MQHNFNFFFLLNWKIKPKYDDGSLKLNTQVEHNGTSWLQKQSENPVCVDHYFALGLNIIFKMQQQTYFLVSNEWIYNAVFIND